MNSLNELITKFAKLPLRERLLIVMAAILALYFIADAALLVPQQKKVKNLQSLSQSHQAELLTVNNALQTIENDPSKSVEQILKDRATVDELKKQAAEADAFFRQAGATTSQVTSLLKELLSANPGLALVSLKTLPIEPFQLPNSQVAGSDNAPKEAQKIIYKYGVEINIKGNYMALLSYMENLQKHPRRLFWSEAKLEVAAWPDATLKLVVYSLGDQSSSSLR